MKQQKLKLAFSCLLVANCYLANAQNSLQIDSTFGINGRKHISTAKGTSMARDIAISNDNKIIVAGNINNKSSDLLFYKSFTNGTVDSAFGNNGLVEWNLGADELINGIAIQADNKVVGVGTMQESAGYRFLICRINASGSIDSSFANNGYLKQSVVNGNSLWNPILTKVKLQADGKIVAVGRAHYGNYYRAFVQRFNTDGSLDANFGTNGTSAFLFANNRHSYGQDLDIQSDGKILVLGDSYNSNYLPHVARLNSDGTLDNNFGSNGVITPALTGVTLNYTTSTSHIKILSNGDFQITGNGAVAGTDKVWTLRLQADGQPNLTYGNNGLTTITASNGANYAYTAYIHADYSLSIPVEHSASQGNSFKIVKLTPSGIIDNVYATNGIASFANSERLYLYSAVGKNDTLYVAGTQKNAAFDYATSSGFILKANPDGILNATMGWQYLPNGVTNTNTRRIHILPSENIILLGTNRNDNNDLFLTKLDKNGNEINTFGINGTQNYNLSTNTNVLSSVKTNDSTIVVLSLTGSQTLQFAGLGTFTNNRYYTLTGIDTNGQIVIPSKHFDYNNTTFPNAVNLIVDNNGDIIISGRAQRPVTADLYLTKHNPQTLERYSNFGQNNNGLLYLGAASQSDVRTDYISVTTGNDICVVFESHQNVQTYDHSGNLSNTYPVTSAFGWGYINGTERYRILKTNFGHYHYFIENGFYQILRTDNDGNLDQSFALSIDASIFAQLLPQADSTFYITTIENGEIILKHYFYNGTIDNTYNTNGSLSFSPFEEPNNFSGLYISDSTYYSVHQNVSNTAPTKTMICKIASKVTTEDEDPDSITGADKDQLNIAVFPNPFADKIHVEIANIARDFANYKLTLTDLNGKNITIRLHQNGKNSAHIDLPNSLAQGAYLLTITDAKGNKTVKKIIKK